MLERVEAGLLRLHESGLLRLHESGLLGHHHALTERVESRLLLHPRWLERHLLRLEGLLELLRLEAESQRNASDLTTAGVGRALRPRQGRMERERYSRLRRTAKHGGLLIGLN